jgi:hypothetical protein
VPFIEEQGMTQNQQPQNPPESEKKDYSYHYEGRRERRHRDGDWGEGWRHYRSGSVSWALAFIWAGLVLIAETSGWGRSTFATWWNAWPVILAGAGAIFVLFGLIRLFMPRRWPSIGGIIFGLILLAIGLGMLTHWGFPLFAAIALIAVGLIILLRGVFWRWR